LDWPVDFSVETDMGLLRYENRYREIVFGARANFREDDVISRLAGKKELNAGIILKDFLSCDFRRFGRSVLEILTASPLITLMRIIKSPGLYLCVPPVFSFDSQNISPSLDLLFNLLVSISRGKEYFIRVLDLLFLLVPSDLNRLIGQAHSCATSR
jgi:hypothetical protein